MFEGRGCQRPRSEGLRVNRSCPVGGMPRRQDRCALRDWEGGKELWGGALWMGVQPAPRSLRDEAGHDLPSPLGFPQ